MSEYTLPLSRETTLPVRLPGYSPANNPEIAENAARVFFEKIETNINRATDNKEQHGGFRVIAFNPKNGELYAPVTVRFLSGRSRSASVHYCNAFISSDTFHACGTGKAGGWGYHKDSAALAEAFRKAGVRGLPDIAGRGEAAARHAACVVAAALGLVPLLVVGN